MHMRHMCFQKRKEQYIFMLRTKIIHINEIKIKITLKVHAFSSPREQKNIISQSMHLDIRKQSNYHQEVICFH
jgi:hypothetical protein